MKLLVVVLITLTLATTATGQTPDDDFAEPRFLSGQLPGLPPLAADGGITIVELEIAPSGIVIDATPLAEAPPFTDAIREQTPTWRFRPARSQGATVASTLLLIGLFRPPVLVGGELLPPEAVKPPSEGLPYPVHIPTPVFPPNALYEGVALVEIEIDDEGGVRRASILSTENAFDDLALETAGALRFRPARRDGGAVTSGALVLFGFTQPRTPGRLRRR